ncbi:MAG: hypothetical protein D6775_06760 [Caldilineae bacterium]|nr:MAG: hypothetical protein D6775_06760 [Caldilineae bacterium]
MSSRARGILLVILATGCWSTAGIWTTQIINGSGISAVALAFWRDLVTFLILWAAIALFAPRYLRVRRRDLPYLAAMGAFGLGALHATWNLSVMLNGVSIATVLQYNAPIFVTVLARVWWRESITWQKAVAIGLALGGTLLIASPWALSGVRVTVAGVMVGLACALATSIYNLLGKRLSRDYSPWSIVLYVFGFGALGLLPLSLLGPVPRHLTPTVLPAFLGFILVPTVGGFGFYTRGLQDLQASVASILATTEVPLAAFLSFVLLGERLGGWQIAGALMVVAGVLLVSASGREPGRVRVGRAPS